MSYGGAPYGGAPYGGEPASSGGASFSISPTSGHETGTIAITATGIGTTWSGSNPFSVTGGTGSASISNYANISGTSATFDLVITALGTLTITDSDSGTNQTYDGSAVVPNAPTIGTAVKGNASASVSFTESTDNGGSAITGHTATSTPGSFTGTGSSPITVSGLTNGTAYTFTVHSTNAVGNSAESSASNSVTPSTVPSAPTIGTAYAGNGAAYVPFTAPSNGGATIIDYTATSSPGGFTGTLTQAGSGTVTVSGLSNGTAYTFTVRARNSNGNSSESSASNSVTPAATVAILQRAPYMASDTIGTKTYQVYDIQAGALTAVGSAVTTGFSQSGNITNGWRVLVEVVPNGAYGDFAGIAIFDNINSAKDAIELYSPPTAVPATLVKCQLSNFTGQLGTAPAMGLTLGATSGTNISATAASGTPFASAQAGDFITSGTGRMQITTVDSSTVVHGSIVDIFSGTGLSSGEWFLVRIGYTLYDVSGNAGAHTTNGILAVPGVLDTYVTKLALSPDATFGAQYAIEWDAA